MYLAALVSAWRLRSRSPMGMVPHVYPVTWLSGDVVKGKPWQGATSTEHYLSFIRAHVRSIVEKFGLSGRHGVCMWVNGGKRDPGGAR